MCGVYKITNITNGKIYVGSSKDISRRWNEHIRTLEANAHINPHLQNAWNKYGKNNFTFEVIEQCDGKNQYEREQYYIDLYKPFQDKGYNIVQKISNDLIGGITIQKECVKCHKLFDAPTHRSKYCPMCKEEQDAANLATYREWIATGHLSQKTEYEHFCDEMSDIYGSIDYFWETV
jgi:group I intron endonuclease